MSEDSQSTEQASEGGEKQEIQSELSWASQDVSEQDSTQVQMPQDQNEKYKDYQFGSDGRPFEREKKEKKDAVRDDLQKYLKYPEVAQVFDFCKMGKKCDDRPMIGKRIKKKGVINKGKYVSFKIPREKSRSIAIDATIRAAAPHQKYREKGKLALTLKMEDIREKIYEYQAPLSIVFVLDASGSMFRMLKQMKDVILNLHEEAYKHRDRVGLVTFQGYDAIILQQPTINLNLVIERLSFVQSDSWTPLASGILKGMEVLKIERNRNKDIIPVLAVLSDGGANVPISSIPPPPFHNFQYYNMLEEEIITISKQLKKDHIQTIMLWPEQASMRGERHKRIAESIAKFSEGLFFQIKPGASLGALFSKQHFAHWRKSGRRQGYGGNFESSCGNYMSCS
ncbi:MAG: VWA domain-containing protein [Candidatus Lokiarchaeota archaeon]|nr:VWA domain-containing protein [Candidatus Lokiarchaeota archaeon]